MKLYLIRHGQTDWNLLHKIQGHHDIALNETGIKQALQVAEGMVARPVSYIFSSPLQRAQETAKRIGDKQQAQLMILTDLREVEFGLWEGSTYEEIKVLDGIRYEQWRNNPVEVSPPEGENQIQIYQRCKNVIKSILGQTKEDVAIVSHGAFLAHLVSFLLHHDLDQSGIIVSNASITTLNYSFLTEDFFLLDVNDTKHLY